MFYGGGAATAPSVADIQMLDRLHSTFFLFHFSANNNQNAAVL